MNRDGFLAGLDCGVCAKPDLWDRRAAPIFQAASEQALAEAHAEIARLTAECERVKVELKEALVGVSYGRRCEKELLALRAKEPYSKRGWVSAAWWGVGSLFRREPDCE